MNFIIGYKEIVDELLSEVLTIFQTHLKRLKTDSLVIVYHDNDIAMQNMHIVLALVSGLALNYQMTYLTL